MQFVVGVKVCDEGVARDRDLFRVMGLTELVAYFHLMMKESASETCFLNQKTRANVQHICQLNGIVC
jgi:hypothetical protein